ncbi:response regulator transcription factor [Joostella atrarenae]|uniref:Response regulator transcription factor n=1 Tax=Joostella atrarenae TaxID=679257 RepID=A0ABS9J7J9_9FLAO|nr:response regulator [Joostella atrarenae]MCF8716392.1 response regulator transcription factor [Joostella atrarenae]
MNTSKFQILLVDDHPLITDAYEHAFINLGQEKEMKFQISVAHDFPSALHALDQRVYDIVFVDVQLEPSEQDDLLSGEDLGVRIRERFDNTKIVMSTTFNDHYRIQSIIEQVSPDGFLIKNDLTPPELQLAIWKVLKEPPYYSKTVVESMRQFISNDFVLDRIDRQLLYYLAQGANQYEIADLLSLSRAAIVKRKKHLKEVFDVENREDRILLEKARKKGFI